MHHLPTDNPVPRFLLNAAITACAVVIWSLFMAHPALAARVELTNAEKKLVEAEGELRLCVDPDWRPFEEIDEHGTHQGIAADLLRLISERTGIGFTLVPTANWEESLAFSRTGKCEALSFLNETPKRKEWLSFSRPLFTDVNVFITREEHPFISDPAELVNETLALPKGTAMEEFIRRDYPNLRIVTVDSEADALLLVTDRKVDMTLRSLIVAAHTIKSEGWFNLKISGQLPAFTNKLRVGVTKNKGHLLAVLDKGIESINAQDRGAILNKHISINVQTVTDYSLLYKISSFFLGGGAIVGFWLWQLKKHNRELQRISQTDTLTGLANRAHLNALLAYEHARTKRYSHPLSVIIIDLDFFKKVNDEWGHLTGDAVLREFGGLLESGIRDSDFAGRWGGEELLIICPVTDTDSATAVAARLVALTADHQFPTPQRQTISAGIATLSPGETLDELLSRADEALYHAKKSGRNRAHAITENAPAQQAGSCAGS